MGLPGSWAYPATRYASIPASAGAGSQITWGTVGQSCGAGTGRSWTRTPNSLPPPLGWSVDLHGAAARNADTAIRRGLLDSEGLRSGAPASPPTPDCDVLRDGSRGADAGRAGGSLTYLGEDGRKSRIRAFAMILSWSRACYAELVRRADTAALIQGHAEAFEHLGVGTRRRLYDHARAVRLGRAGMARWNGTCGC